MTQVDNSSIAFQTVDNCSLGAKKPDIAKRVQDQIFTPRVLGQHTASVLNNTRGGMDGRF